MLKLELQKLELLEETCDLCGAAYKRKPEIIVALNALYADEERFWLKNPHEHSLLQGDNNTTFFIKFLMVGGETNTMHALEGPCLLVTCLN